MVEGWTKNLKLLFDNALALAIFRPSIFFFFLDCRFWLSSCGTRAGPARPGVAGRGMDSGAPVAAHALSLYMRVAKSNFPFLDCAISPLGLPLFVGLLYRSWFQHRILKRVSWKGREYRARGFGLN